MPTGHAITLAFKRAIDHAATVRDAFFAAVLDAQPLDRAVRGADIEPVSLADIESRAFWRALADPEYDADLRTILIADQLAQRRAERANAERESLVFDGTVFATEPYTPADRLRRQSSERRV